MDQGNLFGTDGIRDLAGHGMLAPAMLRRLGPAIASTLADGGPLRVLVGMDTRPSGPEIEAELGGALAAAGARVESAGMVPTPTISMLVPDLGFNLGIVISASHNPPEINGVKLFDRAGCKLEPALEERITARFHSLPAASSSSPQAVHRRPGAVAAYLEHLLRDFGEAGFLAGMNIALDCARGATTITARAAFERAGARVTVLFEEPDGARINDGCGSTHPQALCAAVRAGGMDLGVAFDGDGDRAILVDELGQVVDGDEMLALWAVDLAARDLLPGRRLVATVMSNAGMESYLRGQGIDMARTPVGDREVFSELERCGNALGGEQSGHIIYRPEASTGDGVRSGLHLAQLVARSGRTLSALRAEIPRFPQVLLNVPVQRKPAFESLAGLTDLVAETEAGLAGRGRVLLRYSGTEPLARILIEGPDDAENRQLAQRIADLIVRELG